MILYPCLFFVYVFLVHSIAIKNIKKQLLLTLILHLFPEKNSPKKWWSSLCLAAFVFPFPGGAIGSQWPYPETCRHELKINPQTCNGADGGVDSVDVNFSQMILVAFFLKFTWWDVRDSRQEQGSPWGYAVFYGGTRIRLYKWLSNHT